MSQTEPEWFYADNAGAQQGPLSKEALLRLRASGQVGDATPVWTAGMDDWKDFAAVLTINSPAAIPPPPAPLAQPVNPSPAFHAGGAGGSPAGGTQSSVQFEFCTACGVRNPVVSKFCAGCGAAIGGRAQPVAVAVGGGGKWIIIAVALVVGIMFVGILAAIAIPAYHDYTIRAKITDGLARAAPVKTAFAEYVASEEVWPGSMSDLGLSEVDAGYGPHIASIAIGGDAEIVITYKPDIVDGQSISLIATANEGYISWACRSDSIKPRYLPTQCR